VAYGKELMACEIPMTVFLERTMFDKYFVDDLERLYGGPESGEFVYKCEGGLLDGAVHKYKYCRYPGHITVVFFEKTDLFLWPYRSMAHAFSVNTGNPGKDTLGYMMVQCQKSEWLAIACQMNKKPVEYLWIDFGIFHMFGGKIDVFQTNIYKMRGRIMRRGNKDKIIAARCVDPGHAFSVQGDIYKDINWLFAGSVIGGREDAVKWFATKMREYCFRVLREKNTIMWEINVWAIIYRDFPNKFSLYASNHSDVIFNVQ
jgi:hypothetical protein